jgi:general stress protein 26
MDLTKEFLFNFISKHKFAVLATSNENHNPEAALIGFAVTRDLKIILDTVTTSRKFGNILTNPSVALVIGWKSEQTVQYEGIAKIATENELNELLKVYFNVFPKGKERIDNWTDLTYICIEPRWIRYSDFNIPQRIEEMNF